MNDLNLIYPNKKYNIIVADVPWRYDPGMTTKNRLVNNKYQTLPVEALLHLDVQSISDENCVLFFWATWVHMQPALDIIKAWGFEYKTSGFVWVKKNKIKDTLFMGMGRYTRANTEFCLIGAKGKLPRQNRGVHEVIISPVGKHSSKPEEAQDRIELLYGDVPRVELFARRNRERWDCIGYDSNGMDVYDFCGVVEDESEGIDQEVVQSGRVYTTQ